MTKLNPIQFVSIIKEKGFKIFTPWEVSRIFNVSYDTARSFIWRYTKKNLIKKLRNGLYILSDYKPNEFLIANKLYNPSYVSLETALSYHHIIPETVYAVTSVTTKRTREFTTLGLHFTYSLIKEQAFVGYNSVQTKDGTILLADPEKVFVDYLYFVSLKKKMLNDRMEIKRLNKQKVLLYAQRFTHPALDALLKQIL